MNEKLQDFFDNHDIQPKKENARSYIFDCPACGGSSKLYIEKSNGRSICFKHSNENCPNTKTGIVKTLSLISELSFEQIKKELEGEVVATQKDKIEILDTPTKKDKAEPGLEPVSFPPDIQLATWPSAQEGLQYLLNRGLDIDTIKKYNLGYSPGMRRVVFPVLMHDVLYGWQGRAIDTDNKLKMYNIAGQWKAKTLMFYDNLKNSDFAILTEGPMDALKFAKVGGFVSTMGKIVSNTQIELLLKSKIKRVYLGLDPDAAEEMQDIVNRLLTQTSNPVETYLLKVPVGKKDFGECSYDECVQSFNTAERLRLDGLALQVYALERL